MSYSFKITDRLGTGVRRIGVQQIDAALARLGSDKDPAKTIHETRKSLKKLRSLLRLAKPALGDGVFARENVRYRDIGRSLSGSRDATVRFETLARLHDAADGRIKATLGGVQSRLERGRGRKLALGPETTVRRKANAGDAGETSALIEDATARLTQARVAMAALPIEDERMTEAFDGVAHVYRRARKSMAVAFDTLQADDLHEFRKHAQHHWRHMQLMGVAWPEYFEARVKTARHLSQLLGDDHDLDGLVAFITGETVRGVLTERQIATVAEFSAMRQGALRDEAYALGRRLFDDPPAAFRDHVAFYWRMARDEAPFAAAAE